MARVLGGFPDAESAVCTGLDRYGPGSEGADSPRGGAYTRAGFGRRLDSVDELRSATIELVQRAWRSALAVRSGVCHPGTTRRRNST